MADPTEEELVDYEEDEEPTVLEAETAVKGEPKTKGNYVGIHSSGFRDFLLKPELLRAIVDCGFEHPSEVQHECIPQAILGMDVLCQAKSGMGKTAVFVLALLQQLESSSSSSSSSSGSGSGSNSNEGSDVSAVVLCHTRELAFQICHEFERFSKYLPEIKTAVFYGGVPVDQHVNLLKTDPPTVLVGTPGRVFDLVQRGALSLKKVKHFVLDECDKLLETDMRQTVQKIFIATPHEKQTMMFTATLAEAVRPIARRFVNDPMEIFIDDEAKLTLHGLRQHYVKLEEKGKNRRLTDLLDDLEFNQVVIFVRSVSRCIELNRLLSECNFPSTAIHSGMKQAERISKYQAFKNFEQRILVATDVFGRGIDIERVNIVVNYDMADSADAYLHRVGRAGRFGTKGLAITFVASETDATVLNDVQARFEVSIPEMPEKIETSSYMAS